MENTTKIQYNAPHLVKLNADGSACGDDFKIIIFTDIHLMFANPYDDLTLALLQKTILNDKPDLVVIDGDICLDEHATAACHKLCKLFEELRCYWAFTLGNHDGENKNGATRKQLFDIYCSYPHCLARVCDQNIWGYGNYYINIVDYDNHIIRTLFFLDSGLTNIDKALCKELGYKFCGGYDYIKPNQIKWYEESLRQIAEENGSMPPSMLFIHMPLAEFPEAYKTARLSGRRRETECCQKINTGMFDTIKKLGSTDTVVCGHDHLNDYIAIKSGVTLMYALSCSFGSYHGRSPLNALVSRLVKRYNYPDGHTVCEVAADGVIKIRQVYNQQNTALIDGLEPLFCRAHLEKTLPHYKKH